jgi:UDP:flavonoid glycosyltransferase YjiC (YdhE family)
MSFAASAFRSVLAGVGELDVRVLLTVGRLDPSTLGPLPRNVHVEHWVDQADVLAEAEVVVCHGGSGTVLGALAAGVPMVILPHFGDQFPNAQRVAETGAAVMLEAGRDDGGRRRPPAERVAARIAPAISELRTEASFREAARRIALEMEGLPTPESLLEGLEAAPHEREPR